MEIVHGQSAVTSASAASPMKVLTPRRARPECVGLHQQLWRRLGRRRPDRTGDHRRPRRSLLDGHPILHQGLSQSQPPAPCSHTTSAAAAAGALLVFAPEPVQAFADSHYTQRQEFRLETGAGLALLDWFSGRSRGARGALGLCSVLPVATMCSWPASGCVAGRGAIAIPRSASQRMGRFDCLATLLPDRRTAASRRRGVARRTRPRCPWTDAPPAVCSYQSRARKALLVRIAGQSVEDVRRELHQRLEFTRELLGDHPWARRW